MAAVTASAQVAAKHQSLLHFVGNAPQSQAAMLGKVAEPMLPAIERSGPRRRAASRRASKPAQSAFDRLGDDDFLALRSPLHESRQVRLRLVQVDGLAHVASQATERRVQCGIPQFDLVNLTKVGNSLASAQGAAGAKRAEIAGIIGLLQRQRSHEVAAVTAKFGVL